MILGIGTDIVSIGRIEKTLERFGERFVQRILTPLERARFERTKSRAGYFAKRWAAKEAFSKAIGSGIHPPFTWQSISVGNNAKGAPLVIPDAAMARYLAGLGVVRSHVSLSDDDEFAVAFVVLEGEART